MKNKQTLIICDENTIMDYNLSEKNTADLRWNSRPYYLLNKVINNPKFETQFINYKEEEKIDSALDNIKDFNPLILVHIDRTFIPSATTKILAKYRDKFNIFNYNMIDNSKRRIESVFELITGKTIKANRNYNGEVVVKPNHNAGDPEGNKGYKFAKNSDLEKTVFEDNGWVIERFIETNDIPNLPFRHTTRFIVFDSEIFFCELYSLDKKIKQKTSIYQFFRDISNLEKDIGFQKGFCLNEKGAFYRQLTQRQENQLSLAKDMAKHLNLDFGSIDTLSSEKEDFIIDVNKTPWERGFPELFIEIIRKRLLNYEK